MIAQLASGDGAGRAVREDACLVAALLGLFSTIEHVGAGLAAKPIIDLMAATNGLDRPGPLVLLAAATAVGILLKARRSKS